MSNDYDSDTRPPNVQLHWRNLVPVTIDFCGWWLRSRPYRRLLLGVPAIVLAGLVLTGFISRPFYSSPEKATHYRIAAGQAVQQQDFPAADLYFSKLQQLTELDDRTAMLAAIVGMRVRGPADAYQRIQKLAPVDKLGYGPAHLWIAQAIRGRLVQVDADQANRLVENHLLRAIESDEAWAEPRSLLASQYLATGQYVKLVEFAQPHVDTNPVMAIALLASYERQGEHTQAEAEAARMIQRFTQRAADGEEQSVGTYLAWAAALQARNEPDPAERILQEAISQYPDDARLTTVLARSYLARALAVDEEEPDCDKIRLDWLAKGLTTNPNDRAILSLAAQSAERLANAGQHGEALARLAPLVDVQPQIHLLTAMVHRVAGDDRSAHDVLDSLMRQLKAHGDELRPDDFLLWAQAAYDRGDTDVAESVLQRGQDKYPDVAVLRNSMGRFYVSLAQDADGSSSAATHNCYATKAKVSLFCRLLAHCSFQLAGRLTVSAVIGRPV